MVQQILVGILFAGALVYVGRLVYLGFQAKSGCASGCGKCDAIDLKKMEADMRKAGL